MDTIDKQISESKPVLQPDKDFNLPKRLPSFLFSRIYHFLGCRFLFWGKPLGISFLIWIGLVLLSSLILSLVEHKRMDKKNLILLATIAACAIVGILRSEPTTRAFNLLLTFLLIGLLADHFLLAGWGQLRIVDAIVRGVILAYSSVERPIRALISFRSEENHVAVNSYSKRFLFPILRGVVIAIPILLVFSGLLSSADPIFDSYLRNIFQWLRIEDWGAFIFRIFYVILFGFCFSGLYLYAFTPKRSYQPSAKEEHWLRPFLGFGEGTTVMVLIVGLFAIFLSVQFQYFFGGDTNIHISGYTFAEYARKGTNELIMVSVLTPGLYLVLQAVLAKNTTKRRRIFHILASALILEVFIILLSSFQRLQLYESAYGLTRIRVRTHIFIYFLAGLLLLTLVMEWLKKADKFFVVLLGISVGFVLTLGFINVDGLIVRQNLARAMTGEAFDHAYLAELSADAVPAMITAAQDEGIPDDLRGMLQADLSCRAADLDRADPQPWYTRNPADTRAEKLLAENQILYAGLKIQSSAEYDGDYVLLEDGTEHYCNYYYDWMD